MNSSFSNNRGSTYSSYGSYNSHGNMSFRGRRGSRFGKNGGDFKNRCSLCTYCHNTRCTIDICYKKYGFPIGNVDTLRTNPVDMQSQPSTFTFYVAASLTYPTHVTHTTNPSSDPHIYHPTSFISSIQ